MKQFTKKALDQTNLTVREMEEAATRCLLPETSEVEIAAFLTALRSKGESAEELAGMAKVIREQSAYTSLHLPDVMDNCGTGGDYSNSFNISTTAAFILAGAGVNVAKHGNRHISSKTGSADVLEYLGIPLQASQQEVTESIQENAIAFLFAPHVHPALGRLMLIRKQIGLPTIFNTIGPLTNPATLHAQMIGVYAKEQMQPLAEALIHLGRKRALIVHGAGGMDEASLAGENECLLVEDRTITPFTVQPEDVGLDVYPVTAIRGGDAATNADILVRILKGEQSPYSYTAQLNAALGLYAYGKVDSIQEGMKRAQESIASGRALRTLERLIKEDHVHAKEGE